MKHWNRSSTKEWIAQLELLGVEDWQDAEDYVMELGVQLSDMDYEDMLNLVSRTLSK